MKPIIKIMDLTTNQEIEREMTDEELTAHNNFIQHEEEKLKLKNIAEKNRKSGLAKLIDLGLTEEEVKAFLG